MSDNKSGDDADHLDDDAIITMDDVDYELAEFYRGNRMPNPGDMDD